MSATASSAQVTLPFRQALLAWYRAHRRDLPWRWTRDPYRIWVSEIMLQQTRVAAVMEHYRRFLDRFPSLAALAQASEAEVLAAWSGLGYYRRARMLRQAARVVTEDRAGAVPQSSAELRRLPGVGEYTAAAVASIAFGEPTAAVDGNVERVLARLEGWSATEPGFAARVRGRAQQLLDPSAPGDWNQAMMELGATLCLPRGPLCLHCPVQPWCRTRGEHPAAARARMQSREVAYALCTRAETPGETEVLLRQRAAGVSLMGGMWELPEMSADQASPPALTLRHAITNTNYTVRVYRAETPSAEAEGGAWMRAPELGRLPLTGLARKILRRAGLLDSIRAIPATADSLSRRRDG